MPTRVSENVLGGGAGKSAMPLRFMALVLAAFIGWTAELGATLVVAYRSSDGIVVAADSLRTRVNPRTGQRGQVTACKVREFGDISFVCYSGLGAPGPERASPLRRGIPGFWASRVASFPPPAWPGQRPAPLFGANVALENRD